MTTTITAAQLRAIAGPQARADLVNAIVDGWDDAVRVAKLTTALRAAHFLAQIMTETGGLSILSESGAYSAKRIVEIFGVGKHSAGVTIAEARRIASMPLRQRERVLFNRAYGVGNPKKAREFDNYGPDDGWRYRGGGMMQCTGKANYAEMSHKTGLPLVEQPELLHQPDTAFRAAYLEWARDGRCNAAADRDDVKAVRGVINGGSNGLDLCRNYLIKAKRALAGYGAARPMTLLADPQADADDLGAALADVQRRLKVMGYSPGLIDGDWGDMLPGALCSFLVSRGADITPPKTKAEFLAALDDIRAELTAAEAEHWCRPVSAARASGDREIVATVAPEVTPARRSAIGAAWASGVAAVTAAFELVKDQVGAAWEFFVAHRDDLPASWISGAWGYVAAVPASVWLLVVAIGLGLIAASAHSAVRQITISVQQGARQ